MSSSPSIELIAKSSLVASSTDLTAPTFDILNIKQTAPNDENDDMTLWQSTADPTCAFQWINADWSSQGPQSILSFSILHGQKPGALSNVALKTYNGRNVDITSYMLCTQARVRDGPKMVRWDVCALLSDAPPGTYDGAVGVSFTFKAPAVSSTGASPVCQMNMYQMQMYGTPTPGILSVGQIVGIVVGIVAVLLAGVFFVRWRNLRLRAAGLKRSSVFTPVALEADEWVMESFGPGPAADDDRDLAERRASKLSNVSNGPVGSRS
ncbi:hypothetical protein CcCBS67573_g04653 [Chytriomyces confervae]|uniref:Uncharacterized protein n=1 Tax=Chytriomyces confervae TaxID=246404 RepID=A0A507FD59_9FUNG|nr:hypothetical protein CcCBS67573_g04653 [Chytriomyces confervae]